MPKYENLCPPHHELDLYEGCPLGCLYCIAHDRQAPVTALRRPVDEVLAALAGRPDASKPVYLSPWTDAYQPLEGETRATRSVLAALAGTDAPCFVITKGTLVARDVEFFRGRNQAFIAVSLNTLDDTLVARLEPGAPPATDRRELVEALVALGDVRVVVKIDPVLPGVTDGALLAELVEWLADVKPYAVTTETMRLTAAVSERLAPALTAGERDALLARYPLVDDEPRHADLDWRLRLFRGLADRFAVAGVRAAFCKASLPERVTPHDCRGGYP